MRKTIGASEGSSIFLIGVCAGNMLALFLSLAFKKVDATFDGMSVFNWIAYALMQIAFISSVLVYDKVRHVNLMSVAKVRKFTNWKQMLLLPFICIATILVFLPLANLWTLFLNVIGYHGGGVSMPAYSNVGIYFLSLLLMAVLPAIGEELLMRGHLYPSLSTRSTWFGILMSALFFSLMHANPYQTVHQFGLGVVLAIICALSGSIWACVFVHFFNNFVSITLTAYMPFVDEWYVKLGNYNHLVGFFSVVVGLIALVFLLYLFYRFGKNKTDRQGFSVVEQFDGYTIYASADDQRERGKSNIFKDMAFFFKSLFTKQGWKKISIELSKCNQVQYVGKSQRLIGVWLALGLMCAYWLYSFIMGML